MLLLMRPSFSSSDTPPPVITRDNGWYTYNKNDPKRRTRGKHLTIDEIQINKEIKDREEKDLMFILSELDDEFDD